MNLQSTICNLQSNKGYLLVESMIAATILTVAFLGILGLISQSVGLNGIVSDQLTANYLATEGIELVKNLIDSNFIKNQLTGQPWNEGFTNGNRCYEIDLDVSNISSSTEISCVNMSVNPLKYANKLYSYDDSGIISPFFRTIHITPVESDEIKVNSIVKWTGRGGAQFEVNLEDHFFNWR